MPLMLTHVRTGAAYTDGGVYSGKGRFDFLNCLWAHSVPSVAAHKDAQPFSFCRVWHAESPVTDPR